ncbi:MAG: TolC family protein, partial [Verrucomicrobiales bacterium]|nr:TolC family protein [Verrucomicrobiales bacterium]
MRILPHLSAAATALIISLLGPAPASPAAETLETAIRKMLEYEPELRASAWDAVSVRHDQKVVRGEMLPQVNISGSGGLYERDRSLDGLEASTSGPLFSRQLGVTARQLLWDFGAANSRNNSAKARARMQALMESAHAESRAVDMVEVFLEVLRLREQIRLSEANLAQHRKVATAMQDRFEQGGDRADLALVQGRLELSKTDLETQKLALEHAVGRYKRLTGREPGELQKPGIPRIPDHRNRIDLSANWYVLASREAIEMAEETRKAEQKEGGPKLFAEGGYSVGQDVLGIEGQDNEARALVVLSWNIIDGGRNVHRAKRGIALEKKAHELHKAANAEQRYQAGLLLSELEGAKNTIDALEEYSTRLKQVSSDYDEQFELGKRDILSILDVQNEQHSAQSRLVDATYEEIASRYRLLGLQGYLVSGLIGERKNSGRHIEVDGGLFKKPKTKE